MLPKLRFNSYVLCLKQNDNVPRRGMLLHSHSQGLQPFWRCESGTSTVEHVLKNSCTMMQSLRVAPGDETTMQLNSTISLNHLPE